MALTQIATGMIADGAVTDAKIAAVAASKVTGQLADANMSSGSVLQVVRGINSPTVISTSSTTPVSSSLTATITPLSTSSKILVLFSSYGMYAGSGQLIGFLYRNGSDVTPAGRGWFDAEVFSVGVAVPVFAQSLDSPTSTSALTYEVYFRSATGSSVYLLNNGPNLGSVQLILMEIAG